MNTYGLYVDMGTDTESIQAVVVMADNELAAIEKITQYYNKKELHVKLWFKLDENGIIVIGDAIWNNIS